MGFFTGKMSTAKKTLVGSVIFTAISIAYVNWKKLDDREQMKVAVQMDKERLKARSQGTILTLEDQRRRAREEVTGRPTKE